jgi:hypothetical protein
LSGGLKTFFYLTLMYRSAYMNNLDWLKKFIKADLSHEELEPDKSEPKKPAKKGLK